MMASRSFCNFRTLSGVLIATRCELHGAQRHQLGDELPQVVVAKVHVFEAVVNLPNDGLKSDGFPEVRIILPVAIPAL